MEIIIFFILCGILGAFILAFTGHQRHRIDDDSIESHDNWDDV